MLLLLQRALVALTALLLLLLLLFCSHMMRLSAFLLWGQDLVLSDYICVV